ncbi:MAG TPA: tautomerase family protein [Steroidobacteraceae bacterium]|nr:tautomerase family protein [Steroidobacteraceae bacterium]
MPLVRIDLVKRSDPSFARRIGAVVYESMRRTINVPEHDNFQILAEHEERHLVHDPGYLGIEYTTGLVIIQITLNEGRTTEQKKALYKAIAEGLQERLQMRPADVMVNLVEVKKEDWSFGNGIAQYVAP